jgi:hypothetical protein
MERLEQIARAARQLAEPPEGLWSKIKEILKKEGRIRRESKKISRRLPR